MASYHFVTFFSLMYQISTVKSGRPIAICLLVRERLSIILYREKFIDTEALFVSFCNDPEESYSGSCPGQRLLHLQFW